MSLFDRVIGEAKGRGLTIIGFEKGPEWPYPPLPARPKLPRGKITPAGVRKMLKMNGFGGTSFSRGEGYYYFHASSDKQAPDYLLAATFKSSSIYTPRISSETYESIWDEFAEMYKAAYLDETGKKWR